LAEQNRIVTILNEQMALVEKARVAAEARLKTAKIFPAAYLRAVFDSKEAKRWQRMRIENIGPITDGNWILNTDYAPSGVRLLQVGDVGVGRFVGKSSRFITETRAKELNCTFLQAGDILISRMPDPIGRACVLPSLGYPSITAVDISIFRPDVTKADRYFLTSYFCSVEWFQRVLSMASGATRPRISRSNLEQLEIPLPPLAEQKRIATMLNEKMESVEELVQTLQKELENINALPAALLHRAFTGGL
jgi:type I restriction enzyme S subunit